MRFTDRCKIERAMKKEKTEGSVLPTHVLPDSFDDIVLHLYFEHLFAEGPINGSCSVLIEQIQLFTVATCDFIVQVLGCPPQKYGLECNGTCTCKDGVPCHSFNGDCLCPMGLEGETCDQLNPVLDVTSQDVGLYLVWGSYYELVCTCHGVANADLQWMKGGEKLKVFTTTTPASYLPQPVKSMHQLKNVTENNNGVYTCETTNTNAVSLSVAVKVTVIKIPHPFVEKPTSQSVKTGKNFTLTCRIRENAGIVKWVKGQAPPNSLSMLNTSNRIKIENNSDLGLYQLEIINVTLQDESAYRCYVGHIFTDDDLTFADSKVVVYVDPLEPFPLIIGQEDELETYDVSIGDVINMKCEANLSKPAVELSWFLDESPVIASNEYTETEDGLRFNTSIEVLKPAALEDNEKQMECVAESPGIGRRSAMVTLNVTYKPLVEVNPQSVITTEGEDVSFTCNSTANPTPFSYTWLVNLANGTNLTQTNQNLKLDDVTTDFDNAKIRCEVKNSIGTSYAEVVKFTVQGPGAPLQVILSCVALVFLLMIILLSVLVYKYRFKIRMMKVRQNVYKNAEDGEKEFDFFIAYKTGGDDEDFVVNTLTPKLEEMGFKVRVHFKHFLPGSSIIDNITDSVHNSWKTILVLSPAFLESGWCQYEFKTACGNMLKQRADILPIIYEDIRNVPDLDDNIRTLLNTITYLNWNRGNIDEEQKMQFWKDIRKSAPRKPQMAPKHDVHDDLGEMIQLDVIDNEGQN